MSLRASIGKTRPRLLAALPAMLAFAVFLASGSTAWPDDKPGKPAKKADDKPGKADKKAEKKAAAADDPLTKKLVEYHDKLVKIRQDMLKDINDAVAKNDEAVKKASEELKKSKSRGKEHQEALKAFKKAEQEKHRLSHVKHTVEHSIRSGRVPSSGKAPQEVMIGLHLTQPTKTTAKQLKLTKEHGMVVEAVEKDSPAAKAGLEAGDILLSVDGKPLPSQRGNMRKLLENLKAGAATEVIVMRGGKKETIKLTLPAQEKSEEPEKK